MNKRFKTEEMVEGLFPENKEECGPYLGGCCEPLLTPNQSTMDKPEIPEFLGDLFNDLVGKLIPHIEENDELTEKKLARLNKYEAVHEITDKIEKIILSNEFCNNISLEEMKDENEGRTLIVRINGGAENGP